MEERDALLDLALSDPSGAIEAGRALLERTDDPADRSRIARAIGVAFRELRQVDAAESMLQIAVRAGRAAGSVPLEGLALMSMASVLAAQDRHAEAIECIETALPMLPDHEEFVGLNQYAGILQRAGRSDDALRVLTGAIDRIAEAADPSIEGELRMNRSVMFGYQGRLDPAVDDARRARAVFDRHGFAKRVADTTQNLAWLLGRRGDLAEALRLFDETDRRYAELGITEASLYPDRVEALLLAGLAGEAVEVARSGITALRELGADTDEVESLLLLARAELAAGRAQEAAATAQEAEARFRSADREGWALTAELVRWEAASRQGRSAPEIVERLEVMAAAFDASGHVAAGTETRLLLAELACARGAAGDVDGLLEPLARRGLTTLQGIRSTVIRARAARHDGDLAAVIALCRDAVVALAELRTTLGSLDLQASIGVHAAAAVALGTDAALALGDPSEVLRWVEWERAVALANAPVVPPDDESVADDLRRLREIVAVGWAPGRTPTGEIRAAETRAIAGVRRLGQGGGARVEELDVARLRECLGGGQLIEFFESGGSAWRCVVDAGGVDVTPLGSWTELCREAILFRSAHARALAGAPADDGTVLPPRLRHALELFGDATLGKLDGRLPDDVVVCAPAALAGVPWGLLPALSQRRLSLTCSARLLTREPPHRTGARGVPHSVFVAGPSLELAEDEARLAAAAHENAVLLLGDAASAAAARDAMRGAHLAHLVCHGRLRQENPLLSELFLADGPLFGFELAAMVEPPEVVVLSACHGAAMSAVAPAEVLGLAAILIAAGSSAVVATHDELPDTARTSAIMQGLHHRLAAGATPAEALRQERRRDPLAAAMLDVYVAGVSGGATW